MLVFTTLYANTSKQNEHEFLSAMKIVDKYSGDTNELRSPTTTFKKLYDADKNDVYANVGFGRVLAKSAFIRGDQYDDEKLKNANYYFQNALHLAPDNYYANYYAFLFYYEIVQDKTLSNQLYQKLSKLKPKAEETLCAKMLIENNEALANQLIESKGFSIANKALKVLKEVHKNNKETKERLLLKGIEIAKKHNANPSWDYFSYAWFLTYSKREFDKSMQMLEKSKKHMIFGVQDELEAEIYFRQGYQYLWKQKPANYKKAIELFSRCENIWPEHKKYQVNMGIALYYYGLQLHKKEFIYQAKTYLERAGSKNSNYGNWKSELKKVERTIYEIDHS